MEGQHTKTRQAARLGARTGGKGGNDDAAKEGHSEFRQIHARSIARKYRTGSSRLKEGFHQTQTTETTTHDEPKYRLMGGTWLHWTHVVVQCNLT